MKPFETQLGLTIIELLITVSIAAILISIAIPSFTEMTANQRVVATTTNLVSATLIARSEAVKQNRHVTLCASNNSSSCLAVLTEWRGGWIVFANTSSADLTRNAANEPLIQVYEAPKGINNITLAAEGGAVTLLSYRPTGVIGNIAANQQRLFTVCDPRGATSARAVLISRAGRATTSATGFAGAALACP